MNQMDRMPVVFVPHGGGPWPFVEMGFRPTTSTLAGYLRRCSDVPPTPPKALLVVSAHWEEPVPTVMTSARPPMLYDYYGFPPESYKITWPAPGEPALAARVQRAARRAPAFAAADDDARGFDHGTFVPLKLTYPDADVPAVQLSLKRGPRSRGAPRDRPRARAAARRGRVHHRQRHDLPQPARVPRSAGAPVSEAFDAWLRETRRTTPAERDRAARRSGRARRPPRRAPARGAPAAADGGRGRRRRRSRPTIGIQRHVRRAAAVGLSLWSRGTPVGLREAVARVRDGERAVLLSRHLDPMRGPIVRRRGRRIRARRGQRHGPDRHRRRLIVHPVGDEHAGNGVSCPLRSEK